MARVTQQITCIAYVQLFRILSVSIILFLFAPQKLLFACGSIDDWIAVYERGEKHKALFHMMDCADNYRPPADDIALLWVVKDALGSGTEVAKEATGVFTYFNHLWGARHELAYAVVFKAVTGRDDWSRLAEYQDWMVVTAIGGANMRERASRDSRVITTVKQGMQVKALSKQGAWIKIRPVGPGSVDRRFQRKMGYVHESLLAPY